LSVELPHFAVHAYWSDETDKKLVAGRLKELGKPLPLWQSEWCQMEGGHDPGMDPALVLARCVHEDLTILDCTAWQTWIAVSCYDYKDGLIHADLNTQSVTDMKRLWALGNYSRFLRPGSVRLGLSGVPDNLLASAWLLPDGARALVVINESHEPMRMDIQGLTGSFDVWETSKTHDLTRVGTALRDTCLFPARSITTLLSAGSP
jgi:O-glycosyl hydrolase